MSACKVAEAAALLPGEDHALLWRLLDGEPDGQGRRVPATALSTALRRLGHAVGPTTIKDHRGLRCVCESERTTA